MANERKRRLFCLKKERRKQGQVARYYCGFPLHEQQGHPEDRCLFSCKERQKRKEGRIERDTNDDEKTKKDQIQKGEEGFKKKICFFFLLVFTLSFSQTKVNNTGETKKKKNHAKN